MNAIIVSAADHMHFPLLKDLILSLHRVHFQALASLGVIDLGLNPEEKNWLFQHGIEVVSGGERAFGRPIAGALPFHPAQLAKLYLPEYFPDYQLFLWLDADIWVQNQDGLALYLQGARDYNRLVITPQIHRCYMTMYWPVPGEKSEHRILKKVFGHEVAESLSTLPIINTGAFALSANAEVWAPWRKLTHHFLDIEPDFFAEQLALNYLIYQEYFSPPLFLPSWCNYICHLAMPLWDEEKRIFCEPPIIPQQEIGLVHLAGQGKFRTYDLFTTQGKRVQMPLLFSATHPDFCLK